MSHGTMPRRGSTKNNDEAGAAGGIGDSMRVEATLEGLVGTLWRRKWLIVGPAILGTALAMFAGSQITPRYTAKTLMMIEPREANLVGLQAVLAGLPADATTVETQIKVLSSRSHLQRVIERMGLGSDPELSPPPTGEARPAAVLVGEAWQGLVAWLPGWRPIAAGVAEEPAVRLVAPEPPDNAAMPLAVAPAAEPLAVEPGPEQRMLDGFVERLRVAQEGRSLVIGVSFTSTSADKAAAVANAVANLYVDGQLEEKRAAIGKASNWLGERLTTLKDELKQAEAAVEQYRVANNLVTGDRTDVTDQQVADLNRELLTAEAELAGRQVRLAYIHDLRRRGQSTDSLPEVLGSPLIVELRRQEAELARAEAELAATFGEQHPRMQLNTVERRRLSEKIDSEIRRIIANLENEVQIARTRVAAIQASLGGAQKTSAQAQGAELHLHELERAAQATRQLYEALLKRYMEIHEQQEIIEPGARVISLAAAPTKPSSPGTPLFAALGLTVSTALGTMLALFRERLDKGLRSESEIMAALGLHRIGLVPRLTGRQRPHHYLIRRPRSAYTESMRGILASLRLSAEGELPKVVLVTSSVPGEGKTTLAVSLAAYAATSGQRVVLVDLDFHHPNVLRELQIAASAGVVEYLRHELLLADVIGHDEGLGLDVIAASDQVTDPMPLLTSGRMRGLLRCLRDSYDYVIIDSSPLLGVTDARLLAPEVDKVLLVVQWNTTAETLARAALGLLRDAGADVAGVVVTQVDMKKHARYRYGDVGECYSKYPKYYQN